MHARREGESLEMHRRIAEALLCDPDVVLARARGNIARWLAGREGTAAEKVYREWLEILDRNSPREIAEFLVSLDERALRLRQSTPFTGVLGAKEVWQIKNRHAAARA
ncbi:MAG: hypothetical protein V4733_06295 [Verrucomicrobiota bacterium]